MDVGSKNTSMSIFEFNTKYQSILDYYYENRHVMGDNTNTTKGRDNNHDYHKELTSFGRIISEEALKFLLWYDLIIVLQRLQKDEEYARLVEDVFSWRGP